MEGKGDAPGFRKTAVITVNLRGCAKTHFFYQKFEKRRHSDGDLVLPEKQSPE